MSGWSFDPVPRTWSFDLEMSEETVETGWSALLRPAWLPAVAVLVGGVLLHSMNVLMLATVLPSVVDNLGGATLMSWTSSAFLASSIVAATCTGYLTSILGARTVFCTGAAIFGLGALTCALAPTMGQVVAGRFVQGFGGGLLTAMAYVLVRSTFPENLWARGFALLSGAWSMSILVGPLVGGLFARYGDWRGAFFAVTAMALILVVVALRALPLSATSGASARVPGLRVLLICVAIAAMSLMAIAPGMPAKLLLLAGAIAALVLTMSIDRRAAQPLLPTDAFSFGSITGVGLWLCLLVAIAYSPLQIFVAIFLQSLHGLDPLEAGYMVAGASFGWTGMSLDRRRHAGATQRPAADRGAAHDGGGSARRRPVDAAEAGAGRLSGGCAGRRRHRRVLGLHCPEGHERRAGG